MNSKKLDGQQYGYDIIVVTENICISKTVHLTHVSANTTFHFFHLFGTNNHSIVCDENFITKNTKHLLIFHVMWKL